MTIITMSWNRETKNWDYTATISGGSVRTGQVGVKATTTGLSNLRKKLAGILGASFPRAARNDDAWTFKGNSGPTGGTYTFTSYV